MWSEYVVVWSDVVAPSDPPQGAVRVIRFYIILYYLRGDNGPRMWSEGDHTTTRPHDHIRKKTTPSALDNHRPRTARKPSAPEPPNHPPPNRRPWK